MKKIVLVAVITISLISFALIASLLYSPDLRHKTYRSLAESPQIFYLFAMRKDVINRRFGNANIWLNRQLDFSIKMFGGQSVFLPGLMDNASYVINQVKFPSEHLSLLPFINRLVKTYPKLFIAHVWQARALLTNQPTAAIEAVERAVALIPGDERPYRLAINAALRLRDETLARQYCERYKSARGGNAHSYDHNPFFYGDQLRGLLLEIVDNNGVYHISRNEGLEFDDKVKLSFPLASQVNVKEMRLFVSTAPGVSIRLNTLELALAGKVKKISIDDLYIVPLDGFIIENQRIISTDDNGSSLSIIDKNGVLTKSDTIAIWLSVRREPLVSPEICG
jgi:hypothetical protein